MQRENGPQPCSAEYCPLTDRKLSRKMHTAYEGHGVTKRFFKDTRADEFFRSKNMWFRLNSVAQNFPRLNLRLNSSA